VICMPKLVCYFNSARTVKTVANKGIILKDGYCYALKSSYRIFYTEFLQQKKLPTTRIVEN